MPADTSKPSRRKEKNLSPEELKEIQQKRLRGELSCAECRRLKLRCDKKVPCGSCARRGCETICPNGILEAGVGTRFILADTTQLHDKISSMSTRIRSLEDALAIVQATISPERHPLLSDHLLKIKFGSELLPEPAAEDAIPMDPGAPSSYTGFATTSTESTAKADVADLDVLGTLTLGEEGEIKYFGRSAGSETLILAGEEYLSSSDEHSEDNEDADVQPQLGPDAQSPSYSRAQSMTSPFSPTSPPAYPPFSQPFASSSSTSNPLSPLGLNDSSLPPELYDIAMASVDASNPLHVSSQSRSNGHNTTIPNTNANSNTNAPTILSLLPHLPPPSRALSLALSYLSHGALFFRPIKREELLGEVLVSVYKFAYAYLERLQSNAFGPSSSSIWNGEKDFEALFLKSSGMLGTPASSSSSGEASTPAAGSTIPSPHLLAMLFFVFALGGYFDLGLGPGSGLGSGPGMGSTASPGSSPEAAREKDTEKNKDENAEDKDKDRVSSEWSYHQEAEHWFELARKALVAGRFGVMDVGVSGSFGQAGFGSGFDTHTQTPGSPPTFNYFLGGIFSASPSQGASSPPTSFYGYQGQPQSQSQTLGTGTGTLPQSQSQSHQPSPILSPPSAPYDTIRALGLMSTCLSMFGKKYARDGAWAVMSLASKVAQGAGMHRDPARWHMDPKTVQRRRTLWWEVMTADVSHSLALGRPPSILLSFVDCEFPTDEEAMISDDGEIGMGFWRMKYTFARDSFMPVITAMLTAKSPSYATVMNLDRKVREMTLPAGFKPYVKLEEDGEEVYHNSHLSIRDFYASQHRTVTMLYLHRSYFAHALLTSPKNPLFSPFAPSVLAAYRAASVIIRAAVHLFDRCPKLAGRVWFLFYHVFSAAVTVGTVVRRSPHSTITPNALMDLGLAVDLFGKCANESHRTKIAYLVLKKLKEKAERSFAEFKKNRAATSPEPTRVDALDPNLFSNYKKSRSSLSGGLSGDGGAAIPAGSNTSPDRSAETRATAEEDSDGNEDELEIFGGQTKLLMRTERARSKSKKGSKGSTAKGTGVPGQSPGAASSSTPGSTNSPSPPGTAESPVANVASPSDPAPDSGRGRMSDISWDTGLSTGNIEEYAATDMGIPMDLGGVSFDAAMGFGAGLVGTGTGGISADGLDMGMDVVSEGTSAASPPNVSMSEVHPSVVDYLGGIETNLGSLAPAGQANAWNPSSLVNSSATGSFTPYDIGPSLDNIDWESMMFGVSQPAATPSSANTLDSAPGRTTGNARPPQLPVQSTPTQTQQPQQSGTATSSSRDAVDMEELYSRFIQYLAQKQANLPHLAMLLHGSESNLHHSGLASVRGHDILNGMPSPASVLHPRPSWGSAAANLHTFPDQMRSSGSVLPNSHQNQNFQQQLQDNSGDYKMLWESLGLSGRGGDGSATSTGPSNWSNFGGASSAVPNEDVDVGWMNFLRDAGNMRGGGGVGSG
ncbi:hypothetical protein D9758_015363 [Tetrapyrgos nigripes]|uniref:Zn(2)-C6 fungal-type domain-containing protein n=1 Tax=Tetrapyrgos nigripes TaxID=182062 RepID=A0A8H5FIJ6_9AGAR|nr:hypothetical protein D9758_015363 [Tetrapyrgos nigripes]